MDSSLWKLRTPARQESKALLRTCMHKYLIIQIKHCPGAHEKSDVGVWVQSLSCVQRRQGLQYSRPPCPSPTPTPTFGAQKNKVSHCFLIYLPWGDGTRCHDLSSECWTWSQLFHPPLSLSSIGSLVLLHFLSEGWCHLHIWGCWYFSQQSWFQLVLHPAQRFSWCTLHVS